MKMEGKVGTLENDMLADILILDENPLKDITVLGEKSKISSIILNGREVDRTKPEPEITPPQLAPGCLVRRQIIYSCCGYESACSARPNLLGLRTLATVPERTLFGH